ncbi:hypothetical protein QM012_003654 [Aureobasidium pullulans]|uniref:F-box domain-containing protein n=1 Tax=Aureobasidium pullulans TaxID=5580 RepID=A0ABR0T7I1_AURPU
MDNKKNDIKFTQPKGLNVVEVYLDDMYYPNVLKVSKLVRDEYWPLCLRKSVLWINYGCQERFSWEERSDDSDEEETGFPLLSQWLCLPDTVLAKLTDVVYKFRADWKLPDIMVAPWMRPNDNSFMYHGEELVFERIEYDLPVMPRSEAECDSPSEWDYEFDESGFATGNYARLELRCKTDLDGSRMNEG